MCMKNEKYLWHIVNSTLDKNMITIFTTLQSTKYFDFLLRKIYIYCLHRNKGVVLSLAGAHFIDLALIKSTWVIVHR